MLKYIRGTTSVNLIDRRKSSWSNDSRVVADVLDFLIDVLIRRARYLLSCYSRNCICCVVSILYLRMPSFLIWGFVSGIFNSLRCPKHDETILLRHFVVVRCASSEEVIAIASRCIAQHRPNLEIRFNAIFLYQLYKHISIVSNCFITL